MSEDGRGRRPRRRYVAPPRNLGPAADALFDVPRAPQDGPGDRPAQETPAEAAAGEAGTGGRSRAGGTSDVLPNRASEDSDSAWGEDGPDSNEDRLRRDRPPHWE